MLVMENNEILPLSRHLSVVNEAAHAIAGETRFSLNELVRTDKESHPALQALIQHFVEMRRPEHEFEQGLWQAVHAYLQQLDLGYATALQEAGAPRSASTRQAMLRRLEGLALLAEWRHLRYLPLTEFFWRELHEAFQTAEAVKSIASAAAACYLRVLMLDSVNRSNMTRPRIALLASWLRDWCRDIRLAQTYVPGEHVFFVDLQVPRGARRVRKASMGSNCRYWQVDNILLQLEAMRQQLAQNILPSQFPAKPSHSNAARVANATRLVDKLLTEWSRSGYHRERRSEERQSVMKYAEVVHGILNVCQHVKNMGFAGTLPQINGEVSFASPDNRWVIENESKFGFGTFVYADFNRWLEPGYLIAMSYELNPDLAVVGIVRSIEQRSAHKYSVGVEVLSHTPSYVRLQRLADTAGGLESLPPFAAIFLPEDDERRQPASIIMPVLDYVANEVYRLQAPRQEHMAVLGSVLEQQADWIRAAIEVATDITL